MNETHASHDGKQGPYTYGIRFPDPTHRHYKGGLYWKLFNAYTEGSMAPMVVYQDGDGVVWVRKREDFEGHVDPKKTVLRFQPLHTPPVNEGKKP